MGFPQVFHVERGGKVNVAFFYAFFRHFYCGKLFFLSQPWNFSTYYSKIKVQNRGVRYVKYGK